jgi:hypothetical protein
MQTDKKISIMLLCINIGYLTTLYQSQKLFCGRMNRESDNDNDNEEFESMGYETVMSVDTLPTSDLKSWQ